MHFWKGKSTPGSRSGKMCRKLRHPRTEGQHGGRGLSWGPAWPVKPSLSQSSSPVEIPKRHLQNCTLPWVHLCSHNHREVNRKQSSVTFRIRKKKKSRSPERCGEKSLIPLGFRWEGGRWGAAVWLIMPSFAFWLVGCFCYWGLPVKSGDLI